MERRCLLSAMLYIIGLGLGDVDDISMKGLNAIKKCNKVYLENYTSILMVDVEKLEELYGKRVELADRDAVEQGFDAIIDEARSSNIALLVVGDPFGATTHIDIVLRAKNNNVPYHIIHNASIINAVGCCGLQLYSFGETVSIPFWTDSWRPDSFFPRILDNKSRGLHTLCLLDIKVKEPTIESLTKKKREYMPPRFMTVAEASQQLLELVDRSTNEESQYRLDRNMAVVGLARVGNSSQKIVYCPLLEMTKVDLGGPLHSLIIPGNIQPLEQEYLSQFALNV